MTLKTENYSARRAWNNDAQLQADFNGDYEKYLAYLKHDDGIKIKLMSNTCEKIQVHPEEM